MTITGIFGSIGSGKSLKLLSQACQMANDRQKKLILNFEVDLKELRKYCVIKKLGYLAWLIDTGQVLTLQLSDYNQLLELFCRKKSVVVVDEAQIFFNSRNFMSTPLNVLADLCLSRHDAIDVLWCAQVDEHVDKQFRQLTQYFIHSNGMTKYDKALKTDRLLGKMYFYFSGATYDMWQKDLKARRSNIQGILRTWFMYARHVEFMPLLPSDIQLFKAFSSFNRLDREADTSRQTHKFTFTYQEVNFGLNPLPVDSGSIASNIVDDTEALEAIKVFNSLKDKNKNARKSQNTSPNNSQDRQYYGRDFGNSGDIPDWVLNMMGGS